MTTPNAIVKVGSVEIGNAKPLSIIAGPCAMESRDHALEMATALKEVARKVPLEHMLVETDSPFLAPVPFRGKVNQPGFVKHVAEEISRLEGVPFEEVAGRTTDNFHRLFGTGK